MLHALNNAGATPDLSGVRSTITSTPRERAALTTLVALSMLPRKLVGAAELLGVSKTLVADWTNEESEKAGALTLRRIEELPPEVALAIAEALKESANQRLQGAAHDAPVLLQTHAMVLQADLGEVAEQLVAATSDGNINHTEWIQLFNRASALARHSLKLLWICAKGMRSTRTKESA